MLLTAEPTLQPPKLMFSKGDKLLGQVLNLQSASLSADKMDTWPSSTLLCFHVIRRNEDLNLCLVLPGQGCQDNADEVGLHPIT